MRKISVKRTDEGKIKTVTYKNRKVTEEICECEPNEIVDGFDTVEDMDERRKFLHEKYIQQRDMPSGPKSIKELLVETDKIIDRFL